MCTVCMMENPERLRLWREKVRSFNEAQMNGMETSGSSSSWGWKTRQVSTSGEYRAFNYEEDLISCRHKAWTDKHRVTKVKFTGKKMLTYLDLTRLGSAPLSLTWLDFTWPGLTWVDLSWLSLTFLWFVCLFCCQSASGHFCVLAASKHLS